METQDQHHRKLFRALFGEEKLTERQIQEARQALKKRKQPRPEQGEHAGVRKLQQRLSARRAELLSDSSEIQKFFSDAEITELLASLRDHHANLQPQFEEGGLTPDDCPVLPSLEGLTSRLHPGQQSSSSHPLLFSFSDTETVGTGGLNEASAGVDGPLFKASAWSNSTGVPAEGRATLLVSLSPTFSTPGHEYVVRAHITGASGGSALHVMSPGEFRYSARVAASIRVWNNDPRGWNLRDSVGLTLMDRQPNLRPHPADQSFTPPTPFTETLELRVDAQNIPFRAGSVLIAVTGKVGASAPAANFDLQDRLPQQASARSRLDMILCAVDVGLVPKPVVVERGISNRLIPHL